MIMAVEIGHGIGGGSGEPEHGPAAHPSLEIRREEDASRRKARKRESEKKEKGCEAIPVDGEELVAGLSHSRHEGNWRRRTGGGRRGDEKQKVADYDATVQTSNSRWTFR